MLRDVFYRVRTDILMKNLKNIGFLLLMTALVGGLLSSASAQTDASAGSPGKPVPLSHLYWHFLMHQNHLLTEATAREKQGKDGKWLRNHYQQKLNFRDSEMAQVDQSASRLASELKQLQDRAQAIVDAYRAKYPRELAGPDALPPVPPELYELGKKRETLIKAEMNKLRESLGTKRAATLDQFLQTQLGSRVTVQRVSPPRPHDPRNYPLPTPNSEVRP